MPSSSVRVTLPTAEQSALAITQPQSYGTAGGVVVWKKVGCAFLGWYTGPPSSFLGRGTPPPDAYGPSFPAYVIQLLGDPIPGRPAINIEVVVIDAESGVQITILGGGEPPSGILGTTCGVTP
jgi:hypothetical protein